MPMFPWSRHSAGRTRVLQATTTKPNEKLKILPLKKTKNFNGKKNSYVKVLYSSLSSSRLHSKNIYEYIPTHDTASYDESPDFDDVIIKH